jgi:hypothetical protein
LALAHRLCAFSLASLLLIVTNARSVHNATADGDTRTLSFYHTHSGEDLTVTFKRKAAMTKPR